MKINCWPTEERPREKLLKQGAAYLNDSELLAILFQTGMRGINAVDWARMRLAEAGDIRALFNLDAERLRALPGMGPARATQVLAVREIINRFLRAKMVAKTAVRDPSELGDYLRLSLGGEKREKFRVFFLNKKLEILAEWDLFAGTIDETPVYPREIVTQALVCRASAVILAHNHPSGRLQPSTEDMRMTAKVIEACRLVGVKVLDHVIVGPDGYFSFCGEGILKSDL